MSMHRLNITLPEKLSNRLDALVGPGKKSRFIAETLEEKIESIEQERLQAALEEGYQARGEEAVSCTEAFEVADLEAWDDD